MNWIGWILVSGNGFAQLLLLLLCRAKAKAWKAAINSMFHGNQNFFIASVAFGKGVGILEANTLRLYSRLIELREDPRASAANRLLWKFADWVVAPRSAPSFNQAAMDVGSTICCPVDPLCTSRFG